MTVTRTLCLTDVVDSTQLAKELGDRRNGDLWDAHDRLARSLVARFEGVELERTDGIMVMFARPADAVAFALAYQEGLRTLNPPLVARAGIHTGPLVVRDNPAEHVARGAKRVEVDGLAIAMTARVMSLALGGQTLLTVDSVPPALAEGVRLVAHGHWRLKGVADPVEVLEIGADTAPFAPPPDAPKAYRVVRRQDGWVPARQVGTSLPAEVDAFVGRATELRSLAETLDGGARVVAVLGPPGVGKTRLVTRYGWTWLGDWPGGAWFCDLGGARDDVGLLAALVRAVGAGTGDAPERAGQRLAGLGRCLVVLDRFDPRAGHAGALAGLLAAAPEAQFVTTGQEPPGLRGEVVVTLAAPPREDAVALFVRRAVAASKDFDPSPEEREVVGTLVERLERMPLAVELAAAQIRTAPPQVLLARMEATSTRLLTLVSLEIVGSLAARQRLGERIYAEAVEQHDALVRRALAETGDGEELENARDAMLLVFATPSSAVRFALRARAALREWNAGRAEALADRFAVHLGEVVVRSGARAQASLATDTCARLRALSDAGRILLTRSVFDNARQHLTAGGLSWWNHGDYTLAGLDAPVEVCEVSEAQDGVRAAPRDVSEAHRVAESDQDGVSGWRPAPEVGVPGTPYVLERALGEGSVGEVWLARHATTRDLRVFKFCFGAERLRSLRREAAIFQILRDRVGAHPHITFVREVRLDDPPCWLMVDYTDGVDLAAWWESRRDAPPTLPERLELVAQVSDALQAAHEAGVLHRDVKPANVLVEVVAGRARARLTDFGIGQVTSSRLLAGLSGAGLPGTMVAGTGSSSAGTLMFMAPELVSGGPASVRSDVYALGVTLWQLLVGDLRRAPPMDWDRAVSDELLREDLRRCFAGDPAERWESAAELGRSLRRLEVRRAEREAEEALSAQDPSATADRPHHLLELQLLRVGTTLRAGLSHTGPDNKGRLSPQRADVALDPAVLATLHGDANAYGRHLVARVLAETSLRQRFMEVERAAQAAGSFLRLLVSVDPSAQELLELRWEQLCHPETGRELSASQHVLLSRHVASREGHPMRLRGRTELVALVAVSAPAGERFAKSGLPPIDVSAEVARLRLALGGMEVRVVGGPDQPLTPDRLLGALRSGVDVLCLVGHAAYRRSTGAPMLLLQDAGGDAVPTCWGRGSPSSPSSRGSCSSRRRCPPTAPGPPPAPAPRPTRLWRSGSATPGSPPSWPCRGRSRARRQRCCCPCSSRSWRATARWTARSPLHGGGCARSRTAGCRPCTAASGTGASGTRQGSGRAETAPRSGDGSSPPCARASSCPSSVRGCCATCSACPPTSRSSSRGPTGSRWPPTTGTTWPASTSS
jgi:class 3 adenylate cyclase/serine/threonine protein kinase